MKKDESQGFFSSTLLLLNYGGYLSLIVSSGALAQVIEMRYNAKLKCD